MAAIEVDHLCTGKSTTVDCLAGLRAPDRGRIRVAILDAGAWPHPVTLAVLGGCTLACGGIAARVFRWD